jgi:hypothetical protein
MRMTVLLFVALPASVGCSGNAEPKNVVPEPTHAATLVTHGAPEKETPPSKDAPAGLKSSCAVRSSTLRLPQSNQCLDGVAPTAADLRIALEPQSPFVHPGESLLFKLRIVNISGHTLSVRTSAPLGEELTVTTDKNVKIAPPDGAATITPNPECEGMTCSHMEVERGVVVALLPDGVIEDVVEWRASRMVWPPPQKQSCCGPTQVSPIVKSPLPAGSYHIGVASRLWSEPQWIELSASSDVSVH